MSNKDKDMNKVKIFLLLLFSSTALATGTGLPDLGPVMNWIVYGGILIVPILVPIFIGMLLSLREAMEVSTAWGDLKVSNECLFVSALLMVVALVVSPFHREAAIVIYVLATLGGAFGVALYGKVANSPAWLVILRCVALLAPVVSFVMVLRIYLHSQRFIRSNVVRQEDADSYAERSGSYVLSWLKRNAGTLRHLMVRALLICMGVVVASVAMLYVYREVYIVGQFNDEFYAIEAKVKRDLKEFEESEERRNCQLAESIYDSAWWLLGNVPDKDEALLDAEMYERVALSIMKEVDGAKVKEFLADCS